MSTHARWFLVPGALALALAAGVGCDNKQAPGGGGAGGKVASCNLPGLHSCREYRGGNLALGEDSLRGLCTGASDAAFTSTPCPTASVIGSCAKAEGKDYFYEGYVIPLADAEQMCKDGGGTFGKGK